MFKFLFGKFEQLHATCKQKKTKSTYMSWVCFNKFLNNYVLQEKKIRKNINPENFLQNAKQEFPCPSLESFSGEYYNMENKILGLDLCCVHQPNSPKLQRWKRPR